MKYFSFVVCLFLILGCKEQFSQEPEVTYRDTCDGVDFPDYDNTQIKSVQATARGVDIEEWNRQGSAVFEDDNPLTINDFMIFLDIDNLYPGIVSVNQGFLPVRKKRAWHFSIIPSVQACSIAPPDVSHIKDDIASISLSSHQDYNDNFPANTPLNRIAKIFREDVESCATSNRPFSLEEYSAQDTRLERRLLIYLTEPPAFDQVHQFRLVVRMSSGREFFLDTNPIPIGPSFTGNEQHSCER